MRRALLAGLLAVLSGAAILLAGPVLAVELVTSIDLDYTYSQSNEDGDVDAKTNYNQKYEIRYTAPLSSDYDLVGAVRVELTDSWDTTAAGSSKVSPTMELQVKGSKFDGRVVYEGIINNTDEFQETGESTTYSNSLTTEMQLVPEFWPEVSLKYTRTRDYEEWVNDTVAKTFEFATSLTLEDLRLEFNLMNGDTETTLPDRTNTSDIQWAGKATYKHLLWADTGFEVTYEIKESYSDAYKQEIFSTQTQTYAQMLRTMLQNSLEITPRIKLALDWEYTFDQDLLELEYDYKVDNKLQGELSWEPLDWLRLVGGAERAANFTEPIVGEEGEQGVIDTVRGGFDFSLIDWLRIAGKTEYRNEQKIPANKGGSIDQIEEEKSELSLKNKFGTFWDLTLSATSSITNTNDWTTDREDKLKADVNLRFYDLVVTPTIEATKSASYEERKSVATEQQQTREAKIKFDYKLLVLDMITLSFAHEYGIKSEDTLDGVLNFEQTVTLTENTSLNFVVTDLVPDLKLEFQYDRSGSDTEDDSDPIVVDVSYSLMLDWRKTDLNLSSTFKYNDMGDTFDDLSFNARIAWKRDKLGLSGEYQFDKTLVDEGTEEERKLNLKLSYKF